MLSALNLDAIQENKDDDVADYTTKNNFIQLFSNNNNKRIRKNTKS